MSLLVLVNEQDEPIGEIEKMEAHRKGLLHRAFSVFIFDDNGRMLLQQRAMSKYHSGGLWTNACCSHPGPGEETLASAKKRLKEEMGFEINEALLTFTYKARFDNGLIEHEHDHVLVGNYQTKVQIRRK
jgi:isopentenyl-diphosphate delta-isomerase